MDISDELDDLPEIILDSSGLEKSISFEMPDATVIAAQRKLAQEQEEQIKRFKEESVIEATDLIPSDLLADIKPVPMITMPEEEPGIVLTELNRIDVVGKFGTPKNVFLMEFIDKIPECTENELTEILDWYLDSLNVSTMENSSSFEQDDIHCNIIAISMIYLDKKCRKCVDVLKLQDIALELLNRTGKPFQSCAFLLELTQHLLQIIAHFHNRISLARLFNNANINEEKPEYFSRKLSLQITIQSLSQLLGLSEEKIHTNITAADLKNIVVNSPRWNVINPYEQYCMMVMLMNILKTYSVIEASDSTVLKEFLVFLSNMKSNEKWNNGEFFKVKNLIGKTKLFIQSRHYEDAQSPRKSPTKRMRVNNEAKILKPIEITD